MGDRAFIRFSLYGPISTVGALRAIANAILEDGLGTDDQHGFHDADDVIGYMAGCVSEGERCITFCDPECNYASIPTIEATCKEHGLAYLIEHEAGDEYAAGVRSFYPDHWERQSGAEGAEINAVAIGALEKALSQQEPLKAVKELLAQAKQANGDGLPDLVISAEVREYLEQFS